MLTINEESLPPRSDSSGVGKPFGLIEGQHCRCLECPAAVVNRQVFAVVCGEVAVVGLPCFGVELRE